MDVTPGGGEAGEEPKAEPGLVKADSTSTADGAAEVIDVDEAEAEAEDELDAAPPGGSATPAQAGAAAQQQQQQQAAGASPLVAPAATYPGGYTIDVCFEASKLPLDVAIFNSARAAGGDEKIRKYLQAVLVVGGCALVPGMAHALESR